MGKSEVPFHNIDSESKEKWDDDQSQAVSVPREKSCTGVSILKFNGFWCPERMLQPMKNFQKHFESEDNDILLATLPKAGTTWLKAIVFSIVHRNHYVVNQSPLLSTSPHVLVPFEYLLYLKKCEVNLDHFRSTSTTSSGPLILSTHIPYHALPRSIFERKCKIIYLCRNPLDQFISEWHFMRQNAEVANKAVVFYEAFELFLKGRQFFGPFWDQILGYWNASLKNPEKVLFLKYEDLKKDTISGMKMIAQFLDIPFSNEEEKNGLIEEIAKLCSFESLRNMEVNKSGKMDPEVPVKNSSFFRKGEVGDWANYLTPDMVSRAARVMEEKLGESGLTFEYV